MHYPKITIITPSFNQGHFIEQTICSILDQGYPNLEYIIIDGGSSDNTIDIIKRYSDRITYWVSESDRGQAHAINKGLEKATGDIINWINSDDYLEPGALFAIARAFINNPKGEVFCGYTHCFWDETGDTSHTYRMGLKNSVEQTIIHIEMNQPGTFYKTSVFKLLNGVNESLRYVFDNELWMRYLCRFGLHNVILMSDLIAHFRQHGQSKSFGEGFEGFANEQNGVLANLLDIIGVEEYLLNCFKSEYTSNTEYKSSWNIDKLDNKRLNAIICNRYMVTLFNNGLKKEASSCVWNAIRDNVFTFERKNVSLLFKVLLRL